jgi:uncharacterized membrane protein AbrB (regulator of aidB expression)
MKLLTYLLGVIAALAIVLGLFFKLLHWAGAGVIIGIATISCVIFIPMFAIYQYNKSKN